MPTSDLCVGRITGTQGLENTLPGSFDDLPFVSKIKRSQGFPVGRILSVFVSPSVRLLDSVTLDSHTEQSSSCGKSNGLHRAEDIRKPCPLGLRRTCRE